MASSPAVDGNEIVYHTMGGGVYVLNRSNGHLEWSWNAGSAIESSPIIVNDIDYFGNAARGDVCARPAHAPAEVAQVPRREDHLERCDLRRQALHRGLRRPALGALAGVRRDPVGRPREREDLRDACGRGRPGLRAFCRVLAMGLLHERSAPLACLDRLVRLLVAGRRGRSRVLRRVQRPVLRSVRREWSCSLARSDRRRDLGGSRDRRRRRLRRAASRAASSA